MYPNKEFKKALPIYKYQIGKAIGVVFVSIIVLSIPLLISSIAMYVTFLNTWYPLTVLFLLLMGVFSILIVYLLEQFIAILFQILGKLLIIKINNQYHLNYRVWGFEKTYFIIPLKLEPKLEIKNNEFIRFTIEFANLFIPIRIAKIVHLSENQVVLDTGVLVKS